MSGRPPTPDDDESIDFRFQTLGELKLTFGSTRAVSLLRTKARKDRFGNGGLPTLNEADIEIPLKFLLGEKVGDQSGKALRVVEHYFAGSENRGEGRANPICLAWLIRAISSNPRTIAKSRRAYPGTQPQPRVRI
jgi:hypothetical protein